MFKQKADKNKKLLDNIKAIWENDHGEEVTEAYNKVVDILSNLDAYTANMLVNLLWLQTTQKTFDNTVGKKEMGGEK